MSYIVFEANLEKDKQEILDFWRTHHSKSLEEKYLWMYEGNPAGRAKVWVLKHVESEEWVGMTALFPRIFEVNGKRLVAGVMGDLFVLQKHRTLGPALMLQKQALSEARYGSVDFVFGFPSMASEPIMKKAGCELLGRMTRLVKVLRSGPQLENMGIPKYFAISLAPLLDFALRVISLETWHRQHWRFVCKEVQHPDERFDQLWKSRRDLWQMAGERTSTYLRWKYLQDPDEKSKILALYNQEETKLEGFIVYCLQNGFAEIRDFVLPQEKDVVAAFMKSFSRLARSLGAVSVVLNCLENKKLENNMRRFGFMRGKNNCRAYLYSGKKDSSDFVLPKNANIWFLVRGDADT